jgi:hypothetical protein
MAGDVQQGIEQLTQIVERNRVLKLSTPEPIRGRMAFYFVARGYDKEWLFTLSHEALSDFPAMKKYQQAADRFARCLEGRFRNKSADLFLCASGVPVVIQIEWPQEPFGNRAASYVRVSVSDTRDGRVAHCYVVITHQQSIFDLKENPFLIQESIVNSIRLNIDADTTEFYPETAHPLELQEVKLVIASSQPLHGQALDNFIKEKVIWLGFRTGDSSSLVWVPDPWDATYLGTSPEELKRAAAVLDAQSQLQLDRTQEYASIGRALLANLREFELERKRARAGPQPGQDSDQWDVFISHATEDKDAFVRPLAEALMRRGVRVWLDEYSLKLGDSLMRSIDQGLARCRFGVVVLSPAFFAKEWPQKELAGLASRESEGQKIILPIWHNITASEVRNFSPMLSDRFAVSSGEGLARVIDKVMEALGHQPRDLKTQ